MTVEPDRTQAPSEDEVLAMEELVRAEQARARKLQQAEHEQTGSIRKAADTKAKRKQARQARRRNRR